MSSSTTTETAEDIDGAAKVELLKLNAERKKKGLPIITEAELNAQAKAKVEAESITLTDKGSANITRGSTEDASVKAKVDSEFSGYNMAQVQNIFGTFQTERLDHVARLSKNNAFELLFFKRSELKPPEFGVEPSKEQEGQSNVLIKKVVHYHMLPSNIYNKIKELRNQLSDLGRIEGLTRQQFGEDGVLKPSKLDKNDFSVTQLSDEQFARLHQLIGEKTMEQYALAAKWFFGMPEEYVNGENGDLIVEDNSFRTAIDAAMYKCEWAISSSKKSNNFYG